MEVVLKHDVDKVGLRGEVVSVARGYARNFLFPRNLAELATPALVGELEKRERQRARHEAASFEQGQQIVDTLSKVELRFDVKSGPTGSLFGSVTPTDIADALWLWEQHKVRVDRRKIGVETIKRIGRYTVPIEVFTDVTAEVQMLVVPEGGELPPEEELEAMEAAERAAAEPEPEHAPALEYLEEPEETDEARLTPAEAALQEELTAPEPVSEPEPEPDPSPAPAPE